MDSLLINTAKAARLDIVGMGGKHLNAFAEDIIPGYLKFALIEDDFNRPDNLIRKYNELGYRDARIVPIQFTEPVKILLPLTCILMKARSIIMAISGGLEIPNTVPNVLDMVLGIKKGDIYNQKILETNLMYNPQGLDVSSLYLDDGYLFFRVNTG
jgi:outer membrane protein insertion porin family